ncbi:MAG: type II toxin-antitoxin system VapC family toxin [Dermatophilaceae bacterium]
MIVIESSAMVDALVDDPANPQLLALIADSHLHAPSLLDDEVSSALRGHVLGGRLANAQLDDAVEDFTDLRIERYPLSTMMRVVLAVRDNFTVYDAAYVVLAQALDLPARDRRREADRSPTTRR